MTRKPRTLSHRTVDAAEIMGLQIAVFRRWKRYTVAELAERVGVTPAMVSRAERGDAEVPLRVYLEAFTVLGVPVFDEDLNDGTQLRWGSLAIPRRMLELRLHLLGSRVVRPPVAAPPNDDF